MRRFMSITPAPKPRTRELSTVYLNEADLRRELVLRIAACGPAAKELYESALWWLEQDAVTVEIGHSYSSRVIVLVRIG